MEAWVWVLLVIAVLVVAVAVALAARRRRTTQLRERFGPEYDRTLEERGDQRAAEADLSERRDRRRELDIRPLSPAARDRYADEWRAVQARFVDDPVGAVGEADQLVTQVMQERGYPMDEFEQQADVISVDHPDVVEDYRQGHEIYLAHGRGDASTEDLRQAMVHYRALFDRLLEADASRDGEKIREVR